MSLLCLAKPINAALTTTLRRQRCHAEPETFLERKFALLVVILVLVTVVLVAKETQLLCNERNLAIRKWTQQKRILMRIASSIKNVFLKLHRIKFVSSFLWSCLRRAFLHRKLFGNKNLRSSWTTFLNSLLLNIVCENLKKCCEDLFIFLSTFFNRNIKLLQTNFFREYFLRFISLSLLNDDWELQNLIQWWSFTAKGKEMESALTCKGCSDQTPTSGSLKSFNKLWWFQRKHDEHFTL